MESKHEQVRADLNDLGYFQTLSYESVPLVDKLVADLKTTTESLQKYMKVAQNAIEERDNLQASAEPYKCDNARLVRECNDLHSTLLQYREQNEQIQSDLKRRVQSLKDDNLEYKTERDKLRKRIKELELKAMENRILRPKRPPFKSSFSGGLKEKSPIKKGKQFEIDSAMALADQKITTLTKEIKKLKDQNLQLASSNELCHNQLEARNKEIKRLSALLEGGRPLQAIRKDCLCNKSPSETLTSIQDQITRISKEKNQVESKLNEALTKQHEAMKHAMCLAERNKMLEKEMKEIDHLALQVEAECNNKVRESEEKLARLQNRIQEAIIEVQRLEKENQAWKEEKHELMQKLEDISAEKRHLQGVLETSLDDKKRLTDKINTFTIIEHDLNMEIDRLARITGEQRRKIAELEAAIDPGESPVFGFPPTVPKNQGDSNRIQTTSKVPPSNPVEKSESPPKAKKYGSPTKSGNNNKHSRKSSLKKSTKNSSPQRTKNGTVSQTPIFENVTCHCCENCNSSSKHLKELLDKELDYRSQQTERCLDNLRAEKDYYMKEYHKMLENMKAGSSRGSSSRPETNGTDSKQQSELIKKLLEKEQTIAGLQQENRVLSQERYNLVSRLDSPNDGPCLRATCKRTERERDILRSDLERLEEENSALKQKIKTLNDAHMNESDKLRKLLRENEEHSRKLEQQRRELLQNHGSGRATINTLGDQCDALREQLKSVQSELNQQRVLYTQLKTLHEQTDRTLNETQSKLTQTEGELAAALDNLKRRDLDRGVTSKEVDILKKDIQVMRGQLSAIDREKDELLGMLDNKTEKLAQCEQMLRTKENTIAGLETAISDLKKRINLQHEENSEREHLVRSSQGELVQLRQELETVKRTRDAAILESRRLQDDLTAAAVDCKEARKELDLYKRQVDDLKTQLQHYVAEVKRTEDLISNKEIERNELLDQFRTLSHDVNILESNNHTLENEASQSRVQLGVALDHAADLERQLENKDTIIRSYEKQIADLTSQMASLEMQLRHFSSDYGKTDADLRNLRELCDRLESENAKFKRQLREREDDRVRIDRNVEQLRSDRDMLQHTSTRDKKNVESMEKILDDTKAETHELRGLNQDMQEEVQKLKGEVQELKERLIFTSEQLDMYQEKALEYSQQNKQLRREVANERFRRTRDSESSKYPSL